MSTLSENNLTQRGMDRETKKTSQTAMKIVVGFVMVFLTAAFCSLYFKTFFENIGLWVVESVGIPGLFVAWTLIDTIPTPMSYAPIMFLSMKGGLSPWVILVVASTASMTGGLIGFSIGRAIGMPKSVLNWMEEKYPGKYDILQKHGAWGIVIVGLLPMPFAIGTWTAGAMQIPFWKAALALLVRIPKTGIYVVLILSGLSVGG